MRAHIEKKQGTHNIYFSVNQLRTSAAGKKAKKEDVATRTASTSTSTMSRRLSGSSMLEQPRRP